MAVPSLPPLCARPSLEPRRALLFLRPVTLGARSGVWDSAGYVARVVVPLPIWVVVVPQKQQHIVLVPLSVGWFRFLSGWFCVNVCGGCCCSSLGAMVLRLGCLAC